MFSKEMKESISDLMYAFGDDICPREDSVEFMCGLLIEFVDEVIGDARKIAEYKEKYNYVDAECLLFTCKDDLPTYKAAKNRVTRHAALKQEVQKEI